MPNGEIIIGPYPIDRIVLCSADAGPRSQRNEAREAAYFFPGAKWVGAVRNAADRLNCRFVILTAAHGLVDPNAIITPYDMHIVGHEEQLQEIWMRTIPALMGNNQYDVMIFYAGGCPRDEIIKIMLPILHQNNIDLLTFGRPNMFDIDKIDTIVNNLTVGIPINELRAILRLPDRILFFPHK